MSENEATNPGGDRMVGGQVVDFDDEHGEGDGQRRQHHEVRQVDCCNEHVCEEQFVRQPYRIKGFEVISNNVILSFCILRQILSIVNSRLCAANFSILPKCKRSTINLFVLSVIG